jgi:hypothetical protein
MIMKRKFKQRWPTIPSTSTKRTIIPQLNTLNIKKTVTCDVGNPRPGLGVSQKYVAEINL